MQTPRLAGVSKRSGGADRRRKRSSPGPNASVRPAIRARTAP